MSGSSKTRTGTRALTEKATQQTQGARTKKKSSKKGRTIASSLAARNITPAILTSTPLGGSPSGAPERPKVDVGPKAYMTYKSGARAVIRFFVIQKRGRWLVMDMCSTGQFAARTSNDGYATKKEAVTIARNYRDDYGAYAKVPF